ncbi:MAG: L,D-transpeptidase family protein [Candidatus Omnitrophota bacterium]
MNRNKVISGIAVVAVAAVLAVSFLALKKPPEGSGPAARARKAGLMFAAAEEALKKGEEDKASGALFEIINEYQETGYAEKSLARLASIYREKGDDAKAEYYYNRILKDFPDTSSAADIHAAMGEINMKKIMSPVIGADSIEYAVQPGDTLFGLAKRFNTTVDLLKKVNNLKGDLIRVGQKLKIIISRFSILVDKSRNILTLKKDGELFKVYTVSTGKDNCTPAGTFKIEEKLVKPVWYTVGAVVPAGSDKNELGERWMGISLEGYGIHGTLDENTIGGQVTQGCVRMRNNDVIEIFDIVPSGTEVKIVDNTEVKVEEDIEEEAQASPDESAGEVEADEAGENTEATEPDAPGKTESD